MAILQPLLVIFLATMYIFNKTEIQTAILRCLTSLNHNWYKSYDTRRKKRKCLILYKIAKKGNGNICVLCPNF